LTIPTNSTWNNDEPDPMAFLATAGRGRKVVAFLKDQPIFAQGDAAGAVFCIQAGRVRHTVVSGFGKEVTLEILSEGEFLGYGGLAGQPLRTGSATAITDCKLLEIDNEAMKAELSRGGVFSEQLAAYLLARNIRIQEELVDQLFGSSETRVARVLLLMADFGKDGKSKTVISDINQEALAHMAGTTRMRARFFMNKFSKSGFLSHSSSGLQIHTSLLNVILRELPRSGPSIKAPRKL
jgi:CRP-like cAMP-binding protein